MSSSGVQFDQENSEVVDSADYHRGEIIGGCRIDAIGDVDADVRAVFDVNKPARSIEINVTELDIGNLVDLEYRKSSNSVNTPYRVADMVVSESNYNETFDAMEREFKILFEPVIQNASLVLLTGNARDHESGKMHVLENVYYKRRWDTPEAEGLSDMEYSSEFFDVGFEEKDRRMTSVSILFDEVIAECVGLESNLIPIMI